MQTRVRKTAHVLERFGLAMAGAASGLFVAALVGTSIAPFTTQAFLLLMMLGGAVGFYLGIDTPQRPFDTPDSAPSDGRWDGKITIRSGTARLANVPRWDREDVPMTEQLPFFPGAQVQVILAAQETK